MNLPISFSPRQVFSDQVDRICAETEGINQSNRNPIARHKTGGPVAEIDNVFKAALGAIPAESNKGKKKKIKKAVGIPSIEVSWLYSLVLQQTTTRRPNLIVGAPHGWPIGFLCG